METAQKIQHDINFHSKIGSSDQGYEGLVTKDKNDYCNLSLYIEGIHCAACIQKIESAFIQYPEVRTARLNFSSQVLKIQWDGIKECADAYVKSIKNLGYNVKPCTVHTQKTLLEQEDRFLLLCLGIAGFAMGNIMLLSVGLWTTSQETMGLATRDFLHLVSALIAFPTVLFSGRPFYRSAFNALKQGRTNMDVPISVGLFLATGMSLYETFNHGQDAYFDSAVMLLFFLLIGRYLDLRARRIATQSAHNLLEEISGYAHVLEDGKIIKKLIADLQEGMLISIASGEKFPIDGIIETGSTTVDTSLITGETIPREVKQGEKIYAGTINLSAPVTVRVISKAENSLLSDIIQILEKAQQSQAHYVRLADKLARLYTPAVHTFAAIAFLFWYFAIGASAHYSILIGISVLIITCPCALGLAVPIVQIIAINLLMRSKVLVKSGDALERLSQIDTIIFDKTGTITKGKPQLSSACEAQAFQLAASLAAHSRHILCQSLFQAFHGTILPLEEIEEKPGLGMIAKYNRKTIKLGSRKFCSASGSTGSQGMELWFQVEDTSPLRFNFADEIRPDAKETINSLKKMGMKCIILSGDRNEETSRIAAGLDINDYQGKTTPIQKYEYLKDLQAKGHKVLMVGDGLNDTPVLSAAQASMAPGTAIDLAQNTADIVFMGENLSPVLKTLKIARKTQRLVKQNIGLSLFYNLLAIPMAFMGYITPLVAALAMSGSSLIVIVNSLRLNISPWKS